VSGRRPFQRIANVAYDTEPSSSECPSEAGDNDDSEWSEDDAPLTAAERDFIDDQLEDEENLMAVYYPQGYNEYLSQYRLDITNNISITNTTDDQTTFLL
jgi:hypothetical protein